MSDSAFAIRRARASDGEDLGRLSTQLGYPMTATQAQARLAEIVDHADHALFVAESQSRVVGWLQVSIPGVFEAPRQAEIAGLVVDEDARGRGIGSALLEAAQAWACARDCSALRVRSNVIRERAHAFYRRAGFGEIKMQRVFEKPLGAAAERGRSTQ